MRGSRSSIWAPPPASQRIPTWTGESDQASASFGGAVAAAGDVNGDGYSDVIVGAHSVRQRSGRRGPDVRLPRLRLRPGDDGRLDGGERSGERRARLLRGDGGGCQRRRLLRPHRGRAALRRRSDGRRTGIRFSGIPIRACRICRVERRRRSGVGPLRHLGGDGGGRERRRLFRRHRRRPRLRQRPGRRGARVRLPRLPGRTGGGGRLDRGERPGGSPTSASPSRR